MGNIEFSLNLSGHWTTSILDDSNLLDDLIKIMSDKVKVKSSAPNIERVYIGSEFCNKFIDAISLKRLESIIEYIDSYGLAVTFVFPVVMENSWEHIKELTGFLVRHSPYTMEIVANDYGLLSYISGTYPDTTLIAGRLFNKLRLDPRIDLSEFEGFKNNPGLLTESGLNTPAIIKLFKKFNVKRVETEILEKGIDINPLRELFDISFHFPWIYVTTGQICPLGSILKENDEKFKLYNKCSHGCSKYFSVINNVVFRGKVCQIGNAILYKPLFDLNKVNELLAVSKSRLVYTVNSMQERYA